MKKITAILLTILIVAASAVTAFAAPSADDAMRLAAFSGDVTVKNASGVAVQAAEGMALYNGYTVETGPSSTARIRLDDSKEVTLDSLSVCSVKLSGKTAEVVLVAGTVFFKTDRALRANEAFVIRSQGLVNSVRGSFGWQNGSSVGLISGYAKVQTVVPGSGGKSLRSGQGAVLEQTSGSGTGSGNTSLELTTLTNDSIPLVAGAAIADDPSLQDKVDSVPGLDSKTIVNGLDEQRAERAKTEEAAVQAARAWLLTQNAAVNNATVFPDGSSATQVRPVDPADITNDPGVTEIPGNPSDSNALMQQLASGSAKLDTTGGWTISYSGVTVGAGQTLTITGNGTVSMPGLSIAAGGSVTVSAGSILAVSGTDLVWRGTLTNNGTVDNSADVAMLGTVVNNGTYKNSGTFAVAPGASFTGGTVTNTGTVINTGTFAPNSVDGTVINN